MLMELQFTFQLTKMRKKKMYNFLYGIVVTLCCVFIFEMFRQGYVSLIVLAILVASTALATVSIQSLKITKRNL